MPDNPLHVCLPTRDGTAQIATILATLTTLREAVGRPVRFHLGNLGNIPRSRNRCMRGYEQDFDGDPLWALWIDSDIYLHPDDAPAAAPYIARAEAEGVAFAAHYRQADGHSTLFRNRGPEEEALSEEEALALEDWSRLGVSGFGLLYAPMPRGYVFHADEMGEDVHFWLEHPDMELHFAKGIKIGHYRAVMLR